MFAAGELDQITFKDPFQLKQFYDFMKYLSLKKNHLAFAFITLREIYIYTHTYTLFNEIYLSIHNTVELNVEPLNRFFFFS